MMESLKGDEGSLKEDLLNETVKWQEKAESFFGKLSGDERMLENISSYLSDSHYFLKQNDLIRAFEAVIWAWAWMEIGLEKSLLFQSLDDEISDQDPLTG
ncbi:MAG: DUF357 domain-containing protein [Methanothrix sp.]|jgi:hypothetical protein|uniref:DUF357 domain-containing protein n=1 Tax=Methanothrix sp. TaxID=90426 RepID=UPI0025D55B63|nr:DUF357 domain-containing protein [Methanothrix sp.]MCK9405794.1 DUF357 domain-containing protein [Methanothrix sp.]